MKYLDSVDRERIMRRCGSLLTIGQVMEDKNADQLQQQEKAAVDYGNGGVADSSCTNRGGNQLERRQNERSKRENLRERRRITRVSVGSSHPNEDGSGSRTLPITGRLPNRQQTVGTASERQIRPVRTVCAT